MEHPERLTQTSFIIQLHFKYFSFIILQQKNEIRFSGRPKFPTFFLGASCKSGEIRQNARKLTKLAKYYGNFSIFYDGYAKYANHLVETVFQYYTIFVGTHYQFRVDKVDVRMK